MEDRVPTKQFEPGIQAGGPLGAGFYLSVAAGRSRFRSFGDPGWLRLPSAQFVAGLNGETRGLFAGFDAPVARDGGQSELVRLAPLSAIDRGAQLVRIDHATRRGAGA